jgi:hypothetical protein
VNVSQRISHVSQQRVQLLANQKSTGVGRVLPRRNANLRFSRISKWRPKCVRPLFCSNPGCIPKHEHRRGNTNSKRSA